MIFDLSGQHLGDVLLAAPAMRSGDQVVVGKQYRVPGLPVEWLDSGKGISAHTAPKRHMTDAWLLAAGRGPVRHQLLPKRPRTLFVIAPCVKSVKKRWDGWAEIVKRIPEVWWLDGETPRQGWMNILSQAHTVICPDTGTVHMADALGCPRVIGLYGQGFDQFAPYWNREHCVVRKGMDAITVEDVMERVLG